MSPKLLGGLTHNERGELVAILGKANNSRKPLTLDGSGVIAQTRLPLKEVDRGVFSPDLVYTHLK